MKAMKLDPRKMALSSKAWESLETDDMDTFVKTYNVFLKEYKELIICSRRELESLYKSVVETLLKMAKEITSVIIENGTRPSL